MDPNGGWASNPLQVDPQGQLLQGSHNVATYSSANLTLIFMGSTLGWMIFSTDGQVGLAVRSAPTTAAARSVLGLGTLSTQAANAVALLGGTIDGTAIGATSPAAGSFSTLIAPTTSLTDSSNSAATTAFVYGLVAGNWQTVIGSITLKQLPANLIVDTTVGPIGVTLPANPSDGASVVLADPKRVWGTYPVTVYPNGQSISGDTAGLVLDVPGVVVRLQFKSSIGWSVSGTKIS